VSVIDNLYKVSALALVDEEGRLVGDMSAECLRILSIHNFKRIYLPAEHIGDRVSITFSLPSGILTDALW